MIRQIAPICFVLLWSTGWIVARYVADFADPLLFLLARFILAGAILLAMTLGARAAWPATWRGRAHAVVSGAFLHSFYLGGVWWAIEHGLSASLSALISALQPIVTVLVAPFLLGERLTRAGAVGVLLGFVGLCLVLAPRLLANAATGEPSSLALLAVNCLAMLSLTGGSFYQKLFVREGDLRAVASLQYAGASLAILPFVLLVGDAHFHVSPFALGVLAWAVLAISVGAIVLLLILIREGEVTQASQLLFLVPPVAVLQAAWLVGDHLEPMQWAGMILSAVGVLIAMRRTAVSGRR